MDMKPKVPQYEEIDSDCTSRGGQTEASKRIPSLYLKPLESTSITTTPRVKATVSNIDSISEGAITCFG